MRQARFTVLLLVIAASVASISVSPRAFGQPSKNEVAAKARDIFLASCFECHGGKRTEAGINILDREVLVSKDKVVPEQAEDSRLFQVIEASDDTKMPPEGRPRLGEEQIATIKAWIAAGAPQFPPLRERAPGAGGIGNEYILRAILQDIRRLPAADRKFARYFSIAHNLNAGATKEDLELQRDALAKAINHLSWQSALAPLTTVEATRTVLRIDLRQLGWDKQPYRLVKSGKLADNSKLNLFDLALLEYPYGVVSIKSTAYMSLVQEFLDPAEQVRPIPFVHADWFVSVASQPPLYEDFLQLPRTLKELETLLGVDSAANVASAKAVRAGMVQSNVSRNNRVVERHEGKYGAYWKSFDYQSSLGTDNIFSDLINLKASGGEMIFALPNGLQGYFVTDAKFNRIESAPTSIVKDDNASDRTVRNGLSCMRCHDRGMKTFADVVRPTLEKLGKAAPAGMDVAAVLKLYPEQSKVDALVKQDGDRFLKTMQQLLGKPQSVEPLKPVSHEFLDQPLALSRAGAEAGFSDTKQLKENPDKRQRLLDLGFTTLLAGGFVPRDAWEDKFELLVRGLRVGVPLVPLDGLIDLEYVPASAPFQVELKTNKSGNVFTANDEVVILVKPSKDVFIELVGTSARGRKVVLAAATTKVKANAQFRFPAEGKSLKAKAGAGKEVVTVLASETAFNGGELLRGDGVADRIVHRFQVTSKGEQIEMEYSPNPFRSVKKTITIETR
jgi:serine/threonine-protein kinase